MVISRNTLKRLPNKIKNTMATHNSNGQIYFSKPAARLLNAPCTISFDFDEMTCFIDNNGFKLDAAKNGNGFFIHSVMLARFINEKFESNKVKFEIKSTIDNNLFSIQILKKQ